MYSSICVATLCLVMYVVAMYVFAQACPLATEESHPPVEALIDWQHTILAIQYKNMI